MKKLFAMLCGCLLMIICAACAQNDSETMFNRGNYPYNSNSNNYNENANDYNDNNGYYDYEHEHESNDEFAEVESYCEKLISNGDALTAYQYIKDKAEEEAIYNSLLEKYTKIYVDDILSTAKNYADKGEYQQAAYILEEANKVYSCNEFAQKLEEYEEFLPCKLAFCKRIDEENYEYMVEAEDCFGNKYSEVFGFSEFVGSEEGGYAVFYLNGKYNNLSGIFVGSNELYKDMEVDCKIYADGKLIYESHKLGRTSQPVNINLDVTGVEQLRVEYMSYSWWTIEPCCIFDLTASKIR